MKKLIFLATLIVIGGYAIIAYAAPTVNIFRNIQPESDSSYYNGTTTKAWLGVVSDEFCLTGDSCITSWLVGGGGSTTTIAGLTPSNGVFVLATGTAQGIGLTISTTSPRTITFTPTVSSGYVIPLSASTTEWSGLYNNLYSRLIVSTSSSGTLFYVSTSSPGTLSINYPANVLSTTTAAATYEPIQTKGNLTATSPLQFDNTRQVIGGAAAISVASGYAIPTTASSTGWDTAHALRHAAVTLAGENYLSISGQQITAGAITLSGSNVTGVLPIANGGTGTSTAVAASQLLVGNGTSYDYTTLPSCSNSTTSKLLYNTTTRTFTCGTDQSGSGGSTTTITSNIQADGPNFTFATGTMTGLNLNITGSGSTVTFSPVLQSGYVIPLSASTSQWSTFYSTGTTGKVARWISDTNLSVGTLLDNGTLAGVNATSATVSFLVQGTGSLSAFQVNSSTTNSMFSVGANGSTTIASLGTGCVGVSSGSLYTTSCGGGALSGGSGGKTALWSSATTLTTGLLLDGTVSGVNATSSTVTFNLQGSSNVTPFVIASSTGHTLLQVHRNGSLSVGTTTSVSTLFVQGTSTLPTLNLFQVASSSGTSFFTIANNGSTTLSSLASTDCDVMASSTGSLYCGTNGGTSTYNQGYWPIGPFQGANSTQITGSSNQGVCNYFTQYNKAQTSGAAFYVSVSSGTSTCSGGTCGFQIGIYNSSKTLIAVTEVGTSATSTSSANIRTPTGTKQLNWLSGSAVSNGKMTLDPGNYWMCYSTDSTAMFVRTWGNINYMDILQAATIDGNTGDKHGYKGSFSSGNGSSLALPSSWSGTLTASGSGAEDLQVYFYK